MLMRFTFDKRSQASDGETLMQTELLIPAFWVNTELTFASVNTLLRLK